MPLTQLQARLRPHLTTLVPGLLAVGLMLVWAVHDGGYDADTWYWGALLLLAADTALVIALGERIALSRPTMLALGAFGVYVLFSYLSITWAASPGDALQGSNRALLYLLLFAFVACLPWTPQSALAVLTVFALGLGIVAVVLIARLSSADRVAAMVIQGRLASPTGYFNATAALFTIEALTATALASRRELPAPLRGVLIAFGAAGLQLAVIVQSRGWLFTLPLVGVAAALVMRDRLRFAAAAVLPVAATLIPLSRLLHVYQGSATRSLGQAASAAGKAGLLACAGALVTGTALAWLDGRRDAPQPDPARRRLAGAVVILVALAGVGVAGVKATHGHPVRFLERQWHGFSRPETTSSSVSHFADVGSGRYDFWRVSLDAFTAHPLGGLGQDNFADYYILRRHTLEDPVSTHSLELRLLAHTGLVGFVLFSVFLVAAVAAAVRSRRQADELARAVAAVALLPLVVWLIHGSVDWFWEMPALSGPALGFLALAGAVNRQNPPRPARAPARSRARLAIVAIGFISMVAAAVALGFPYLSVREVAVAGRLAAAANPAVALEALGTASKLNPLSPEPGRIGGTIALQTGRYREAETRFAEAAAREPGGWYAWLGRGLAASALGDRVRARQYFEVAASINRTEPVVTQALARLGGQHPLTASSALATLAQEATAL